VSVSVIISHFVYGMPTYRIAGMKIRMIPLPMNTPDSTCGAQWISGFEVQANQNKPG
jgi:hypothetical protein